MSLLYFSFFSVLNNNLFDIHIYFKLKESQVSLQYIKISKNGQIKKTQGDDMQSRIECLAVYFAEFLFAILLDFFFPLFTTTLSSKAFFHRGFLSFIEPTGRKKIFFTLDVSSYC